MKEITQRQTFILKYIISFKERYGISPTFREIATDSGITVKGAYDHVELLEKKGYISLTANISRSILVLKYPDMATEKNPN